MTTDSMTLYPDAVDYLHQAMPVIAGLKPLFGTRGLVAVEVAWKGLLSDEPLANGVAMDLDLLIVPSVFGYLELRRANVSNRFLSYTGRPTRAGSQYSAAVRAIGEFAQLLGLPVVIASGFAPRT